MTMLVIISPMLKKKNPQDSNQRIQWQMKNYETALLSHPYWRGISPKKKLFYF